jgi:hypothetical protein
MYMAYKIFKFVEKIIGGGKGWGLALAHGFNLDT